MTDYTTALLHANTMKAQLSGLAREAANALRDHNVSLIEGVILGQRGGVFALTLISMLTTMPPEDLKALLHVLEHGEFTLPATPPNTEPLP